MTRRTPVGFMFEGFRRTAGVGIALACVSLVPARSATGTPTVQETPTRAAATAGDAASEPGAGIDILLNQANTMYWAGRARPYSSVEPAEARRFFEAAMGQLEGQPDTAETRRRMRRAEHGIEQAELELAVRGRALGGWSPWYGLLLDKDEVIVWSGNPVKAAAERAVAALADSEGLDRFVTDQLFVHVHGDVGEPAAVEAAHAHLNSKTNWYVIAPHEASDSLSAAELAGLEESPPRDDSVKRLIEGMSSLEMDIGELGVIHVVENGRVDELHYLGAYYRNWRLVDGLEGELVSEHEWYADGFAQGPGYPKWAPILLLILGGLAIPWIMAPLMRSRLADPDGRLDRVSPPPVWSGLAAAIAGYVFAMIGRQGLIAAGPDLEILLTPSSAGWIFAISTVLLLLPIILVYVLASKMNSIATRLANQDMVCVLLVGSWFGCQVLLLRFGSVITGIGTTAAMLAIPTLLGAFALAIVAKAIIEHGRTGRQWSLATSIVGVVGIAISGIFEVQGTWEATSVAGIAAAGPVLGAAVLDRMFEGRGIRIGGSTPDEEVTEARDVAVMLREPAFIETEGVVRMLEALEQHVVGDDADDDAIEVVWIDGERGCGKTRIARELAGRIKERLQSTGRVDEVSILFGDCNEPGDPEADIPYEPLRQAFSELMGGERFGNPAENARKLQQGLEKVAAAGSVAGAAISVALNVAGSDETSFKAANMGMIAEEMVEVLVRSVASTEEAPGGGRIVMILDDVQWMDEDSLRLLRVLLERLVDRFVAEDDAYRNRIAIVVTRRIDGDVDDESQARGEEVRAVFGALADRSVVNLLGNDELESTMTSPADSQQWIEAMFNQIGCTERARRALTRSMEASGLAHQLPLYRLEYLQLALDGGYLRLVDGRCDLVPDTNIADLETGARFDDMVKRELDGLDRRLVEILHCCATIGRRFQVSLVAKIFEMDVIDLLSIFAQAEQRGIIVDCLDADDIYEFRDKRIAGTFRSATASDSGKVQQMVREYHLRFVQVRQQEMKQTSQDPARLPFNDVMALAVHTSMVAERIPGEAIRWAMQAADHCERKRLYGRALERLTTAVRLVQGRNDLLIPPKDRVDILLRHVGLLLDVDGDMSEAETTLEQLGREIEALPASEKSIYDVRRRLHAALVAYRSQRFAEVAEIIEAIESNEDAEDWMLLRGRFLATMSLDPRANAERRLTELESLLATTEAGVRNAESAGELTHAHEHRLLMSELLNALGGARLHVGKDPAGARDAFESALRLNRDPEIADRKGEGIAYGGLGDVWQNLARGATDETTRAEHLEQARNAFEKNLAISRETGDQAGIMRMTSMLGGIKSDEAEASIDRSDRIRLVNEARRLYEESTMLCIEHRRSFSFRFGFAGLVRVERIAGTSGEILRSFLDEARSANLFDEDTRISILETLQVSGGSPELAATLAMLVELQKSDFDEPDA